MRTAKLKVKKTTTKTKKTCPAVWQWLNKTDDENEKRKKTPFEKEPKPEFDKVYHMKMADAVGTPVEKRSEIKQKLLEIEKYKERWHFFLI